MAQFSSQMHPAASHDVFLGTFLSRMLIMHDEALARQELGALLRARRTRLKPNAPSARRRTPGLRREDVAERAGISVALYTWLEQGRIVAVSPAAIDRIADALGLSADERSSAQRFAHPPAPPKRLIDRGEPPTLWQRLVDGYGDGLCYVTDPSWQVIAWNAAFGYVHGLMPSSAPIERNLIYRLFMYEWDRYVDPEATASRFVAKLRGDYATYLGDEKFTSTIEQIAAACPRFAEFWVTHSITSPLSVSTDAIRVGELGFYAYRAVPFPAPPGLEDGRFCIQLPEDEESASILEAIKSVCSAV
jgi:transcriptional regulator with XRE-family HTH domain